MGQINHREKTKSINCQAGKSGKGCNDITVVIATREKRGLTEREGYF